jgi:hypothetical protein
MSSCVHAPCHGLCSEFRVSSGGTEKNPTLIITGKGKFSSLSASSKKEMRLNFTATSRASTRLLFNPTRVVVTSKHGGQNTAMETWGSQAVRPEISEEKQG